MERIELNAFIRAKGKSASRGLKREQKIPGILYGPKREPLPIAVDAKEFSKAIRTGAGWNALIYLNVEGGEKVVTRIADYQADVITRNITHVDFHALDLSKKIKVEVPIRLIGTPEGVKKGGILEQIARTVELKCLPVNIPEHIDIDVTSLDVGKSIHIRDVSLPEAVELVGDDNFVVASIVQPTQEMEVPSAAPAPSEVPVVGEEAKAAEEEAASESSENG